MKAADAPKRIRAALVWPKPRRERWLNARICHDEYPDGSDGLLYLDAEGIDVSIEESSPLVLNPLARMHELYSGFDPIRAVRLLTKVPRYDVAICIGDVTALALVGLRRAFGARLPVVLIDPALAYDYPRRKRVQDYVLPLVEHVVVYGKAQEDYLRQEYGDSVRVTRLYHRIDTEFFHPLPNVPTERLVFSIGNDRSRDFETFAAAAELCQAKGVAARFLLQSRLPLERTPPALHVSRDSLSFVQLRELYARSEIVVIPLHDMIHPGGINSLLEAMAVGRPVICSDSSGIRDYLPAGVVTVPPGDADALATAIADLLRDADRAAALGQLGEQFVRDRCANAVYAEALAPIVREAALR
jgi:glycosyltransferase involved in cell wall biosynthesis